MAVLLREVVPFLLLSVPLFFFAREWRIRRRSRSAPWRSDTHSLPEGGFAVELRRAGEPSQTVAKIPSGLPYDEFSQRLADAQAEADAQAAALNSRKRPRS